MCTASSKKLLHNSAHRSTDWLLCRDEGTHSFQCQQLSPSRLQGSSRVADDWLSSGVWLAFPFAHPQSSTCLSSFALSFATRTGSSISALPLSPSAATHRPVSVVPYFHLPHCLSAINDFLIALLCFCPLALPPLLLRLLGDRLRCLTLRYCWPHTICRSLWLSLRIWKLSCQS